MSDKSVMVFGVFDGFDAGHQFFLHKAIEYGDNLIVVVAPDIAVGDLKHKSPFHSLKERIEAIKRTGIAAYVVAGDAEQNNWSVVDIYKPDSIVVGYDQKVLKEAITKAYPNIEVHTVHTHHGS